MNIESDDQTYTFPLIEGRTEWAKPLTEGSWGLKVTDSRATNKKRFQPLLGETGNWKICNVEKDYVQSLSLMFNQPQFYWLAFCAVSLPYSYTCHAW